MRNLPKLLLLLLLLGLGLPNSAEAQPKPATLRVTVIDVTGAIIIGANIELSTPDVAEAAPRTASTDDRGQVVLTGLRPGSYSLRITSPGFDDFVNARLNLKSGSNETEATLQISGYVEELTVGRDPLESASDPRGDTMTTTLGEQELEALPEDEEELLEVLNELAGPGAELSVDGFLDGPMVSRSQIQQIRVRRQMFSADRHGGGGSRIEIVTRPGSENWRSNASFSFRDDALNARNAFAPTRIPERQQRVSLLVAGPIVQKRTSVTFEAEYNTGYNSRTLLAAVPGRLIGGVLRQPGSGWEVSGRVNHALTAGQVMRIEFGSRDNENENLGIGDFDLPERAYSRTRTNQWLRAGASGRLGERLYSELGVQARWNDSASLPGLRAVAVRIPDTVVSGGASVEGGRRERYISTHQKLDYTRGPHSVTAGGLFEWQRTTSDEVRNANGMFTFSTLEDFNLGLPTAFTQFLGEPAVSFSVFKGAWFVQDDIRIRKNLTLGVGLRHEWQSHIDSKLNLGPRIGATWAPFEGGQTSIRGGFGIFTEWYDGSTLEEVLRVDGTQGQELTIQFPGYPDPFTGGVVEEGSPLSRLQASPDLELPRVRQAVIGIERRLPYGLRVEAGYTWRDGVQQFRGRNLNAPGIDGVRPNPTVANIVEIQSIGALREHEVNVGLNGRMQWRNLFFTARDQYEQQENDGDSETALPANNLEPDEWGPAGASVLHQVSFFGALDLIRNLQAAVTVRAESGPAYNITTGSDENGDSVFNDRPVGVTRNSVRGEGLIRTDLRLTWRLPIGRPPGTGDGGERAQQRGGGNQGSRQPQPRVTAEFYARAQNLLNSVHFTGFRGALTSPFFGLPTSARNARQLEIGTRVRF